MSKLPSPEDLTGEQLEALERAAFLVINARNEAGAMLARAGVESPPDSGWFGSPCGAMIDPPPPHHHCSCMNYTGDGGPCVTRYTDLTGPDLGSGPPTRTCGHRPSQHLPT
jgi:hypothetical protein